MYGNRTIRVNSLRPSDGAWSAPSHYLNQRWIIVNWTLANIFQWTFNLNTTIFIEENARQSVICEMASILSRPQCVKDITDIRQSFVPLHTRPPESSGRGRSHRNHKHMSWRCHHMNKLSALLTLIRKDSGDSSKGVSKPWFLLTKGK